MIVDEDGNTVWEEVAGGVNFSKDHLINNKIKGLKVSVIDSGTLYVIKAPNYPSRYW